jgi:hypothetical protein
MHFELISSSSYFFSMQYGEAAKEVLGSTKGTPVKRTFRPLGNLVRTRDHDTIRAESKGTVKTRVEGKYITRYISCK